MYEYDVTIFRTAKTTGNISRKTTTTAATSFFVAV